MRKLFANVPHNNSVFLCSHAAKKNQLTQIRIRLLRVIVRYLFMFVCVYLHSILLKLSDSLTHLLSVCLNTEQQLSLLRILIFHLFSPLMAALTK